MMMTEPASMKSCLLGPLGSTRSLTATLGPTTAPPTPLLLVLPAGLCTTVHRGLCNTDWFMRYRDGCRIKLQTVLPGMLPECLCGSHYVDGIETNASDIDAYTLTSSMFEAINDDIYTNVRRSQQALLDSLVHQPVSDGPRREFWYTDAQRLQGSHRYHQRHQYIQ